MKKLILIGILAIFGWQAYTKNQAQPLVVEEVQEDPPVISRSYTCDGRLHCSQMTSCEEATFFLKNCPGTKMDGDFDGIACEQQWCN
jgi:hypothetical protein